MSTTLQPAGPAQSAVTSTGFARRHRSTLVIGLALVAAIAVAVVLGTGTRTATPMDPDNPGPAGAQALARVLDDEGVDIDVARDADALEALTIDGDTSVVVVLPEYLGTSTIERLFAQTENAARVIVVGAGPGATSALGVDDPPGRVAVTDGRPARCDDPLYDGLSIEVDNAVAYRGGTCFTGEYGGLVDTPRDGLVLFGADQALTNDQVLRADNAAVALRLLGQDQRLVWYVPSLDDLVAGDGVSLRSLVPRWITPALWLGLVVLLTVIVWRGRRLGALATEPLPVVVRAVETTRSLGRLYRKSGDRGHAAESLRRAARARCAERLRLGSGVAPDALAREVARRTGRRGDAVAALLGPGGDVPSSDRDLITLAHDLDELDREVRRT